MTKIAILLYWICLSSHIRCVLACWMVSNSPNYERHVYLPVQAEIMLHHNMFTYMMCV